jgi:hypothetical protein
MDGIAPEADEIPSPAQQLATAKRVHAKNNPTVPFLPVLAKLLVMINDPYTDHRAIVQAAELLLPHYHPLPAVPLPTTIELPPLTGGASSILRAQELVTSAIADGRLEPGAGQALMQSLAIMIRSLDVTTLEDRLEQAEERARLAKGQPVPFRVIEKDEDLPNGHDRDEAS